MTDSDDVLRNAHLPQNPATQEKSAQFAIDCGHADLLAVMGLTVADRAVNAVRWAAHVEAGPSDGAEV